MKKILLTTIAMLVLNYANAQTEISYGAKAGLNLSNLNGIDEDVSTRTSFHLGGFAEIAITEEFSFQPELIYSSQGAKSEVSLDSEFGTIRGTTVFKLDYLNLPLLGKYYVTENFSLLGGPQIGFLLSAKADVEATASTDDGSISESGTVDLKEVLKSVDFGLNLGLEYKFDNKFKFGANYVLGLSNIAKEAESDDALKNRVLQFSVGYSF